MGKNIEDSIPKPYIPADAIASEAKPGYKAGNYLIDENNDRARRETITKRFKKLYELIFKGRK
jgi:hypothetical protein